jgi:hypothetical protein
MDYFSYRVHFNLSVLLTGTVSAHATEEIAEETKKGEI